MLRFGVWDPRETPGTDPRTGTSRLFATATVFRVLIDNVVRAKKNKKPYSVRTLHSIYLVPRSVPQSFNRCDLLVFEGDGTAIQMIEGRSRNMRLV